MKASTPRLEAGASVRADWFGWLPEAKMNAFRVYAQEVEALFFMFSISLDGALAERNQGSLARSYEILSLTPPLCARFTESLQAILASLGEHVSRYGLAPSVAPLDAANFRGFRGKSSARKGSLLGEVLLSQRARYLNKIDLLREMVDYMEADFCHAAEDLLGGSASSNPERLWAALDDGQFDLNTCLRESMILLKSFLRVLPNQELQAFRKSLSDHRQLAYSERHSEAGQDTRRTVFHPCPGQPSSY